MGFFDLLDTIYEEQYEKTIKFIEKGLTGDLEKDIEVLQSTLGTLWDAQGLDWIGRGDISLEKSNASIAATEVVLHELLLKRKEFK